MNPFTAVPTSLALGAKAAAPLAKKAVNGIKGLLKKVF